MECKHSYNSSPTKEQTKEIHNMQAFNKKKLSQICTIFHCLLASLEYTLGFLLRKERLTYSLKCDPVRIWKKKDYCIKKLLTVIS